MYSTLCTCCRAVGAGLRLLIEDPNGALHTCKVDCIAHRARVGEEWHVLAHGHVPARPKAVGIGDFGGSGELEHPTRWLAA